MSRKTLLVIASAALIATHQFYSSGEASNNSPAEMDENAPVTATFAKDTVPPVAPQQAVQHIAPVAITLPRSDEVDAFNPDYPTFAMRFEEVVARRNGAPIPAISVKQAMQMKAAWNSDDSAADALALDPEDRFDGRTFIRFNPTKLESLVPGDRMEIPLESIQQTYTFEVDHVEVNDEESVSWVGHLTESDQQNQVVFTQSSQLTYAGIQTPEGLFVLEAKGSEGWIAPAGLIFKGTCDALPVETEEGITLNTHDHSHPEGAHHHDAVM
ncbi:MAG: hypothetical protein IPM37_11720 [Hahellaceae bacterium]|nr:hypothetical protein [Hahellaceae bacterium]